MGVGIIELLLYLKFILLFNQPKSEGKTCCRLLFGSSQQSLRQKTYNKIISQYLWLKNLQFFSRKIFVSFADNKQTKQNFCTNLAQKISIICNSWSFAWHSQRYSHNLLIFHKKDLITQKKKNYNAQLANEKHLRNMIGRLFLLYLEMIVNSHQWHLNQFMSLSKLKEKLRHYKSLQNLYTIQQDSSVDRRCNKKAANDSYKPSKTQKKPPSRLVTQINDKIVCSKEELKKYSKIFKNEPKCKKIDNRHKNSHNFKQSINTTSTKKLERNKISSPLISRFMPKKEITEIGSTIKVSKLQKKHLKTKKYQVINQKTHAKIDHVESILLEKEGKNAKLSKAKKLCSKDNKNKNKSKTKVKKLNSEASLESTPSCMMSQEIELMDLIGEGTFGKVFKGRLKKTGQIIAIKRVLQDSRYKNREIEIVRMLQNDFVMEVLGSYITYEAGQEYLNIMMKYYQENLYSRIKESPTRMNPLDIKMIIYQMFKGLSYLHSLNICHRDIKPENILLRGNAVAICDFGSAKILNNYENNISYICARCYRAPQLIFGSTNYTTLIDIWSAGCVILQMLNGDPLFIGDTSITHLHEIMKILGTPSLQEVISMNSDYDIKDYRFPRIKKQNWIDIFPDADRLLLNLIDQIMVYTPTGRVTAVEALSHPYFDELRDQQTYLHIQTQYKLNNFFDFSEEELVKFKHLKSRVIPTWRD